MRNCNGFFVSLNYLKTIKMKLTPQEKASELLEKFDLPGEKPIFIMSSNHVKQCALLSVEELIKAFKQLSIEESGRVHIDFGHGYWESVKEELEKM